MGRRSERIRGRSKDLAAHTWYTVKWSVVAKDGHRTEGSYTFTVREDRGSLHGRALLEWSLAQ
jgi:hypothetical protein